MTLTCHTCGEHLDGDGYTSVLRCPNAEEQGADLNIAPDSNPVYCTEDYDGPDYPDGPEFEGWAQRSTA
jgi:hypothetical protein